MPPKNYNENNKWDKRLWDSKKVYLIWDKNNANAYIVWKAWNMPTEWKIIYN